jgi:hypothetical protein
LDINVDFSVRFGEEGYVIKGTDCPVEPREEKVARLDAKLPEDSLLSRGSVESFVEDPTPATS